MKNTIYDPACGVGGLLPGAQRKPILTDAAIMFEAQDAFWAVVATHHPECKSGGFPPDTSHWFDAACRAAIEIWVSGNSPLPLTPLIEKVLAKIPCVKGDIKVISRLSSPDQYRMVVILNEVSYNLPVTGDTPDELQAYEPAIRAYFNERAIELLPDNPDAPAMRA